MYIYAQVNQYDFYIDHDNWQYTYQKGWHDYFTTLKLYDPAVPYERVERYSWHTTEKIVDYTLQQYYDAVNEIFKLKDELLAYSEQFIKSIGGDYDSIYVRRGDKVIENTYASIPELIVSITLDPARKLFVQTDDIAAVEEIRVLLPGKEVHTMTPHTSRGADMFILREMNAEDTRKHTEELLISIVVFMRGCAKYSDNQSNIGRLHKIMGLESVTLYPRSPSNVELRMTTVIRPQYDMM
jgi:hypothetical protein